MVTVAGTDADQSTVTLGSGPGEKTAVVGSGPDEKTAVVGSGPDEKTAVVGHDCTACMHAQGSPDTGTAGTAGQSTAGTAGQSTAGTDAVGSGQRHSVCRDASETLECLPPCPGTMSYGGSFGSQRYSVRHESSETREGLPPCNFECHGLGLGVGCGTHGWCASVECHGLGMGIASVLQSEECAHGEAQRHECAAEAPV